ncbi:MAG: arginase family protein, partial [Gemmatimonadetes bacterium]|nr:arginase family protein [Gemmatimonadota bacterium]
MRNQDGVAAYSRALARNVSAAADDGSFVLVLGGDCSIVLGCLLGIRRPGRSPAG